MKQRNTEITEAAIHACAVRRGEPSYGYTNPPNVGMGSLQELPEMTCSNCGKSLEDQDSFGHPSPWAKVMQHADGIVDRVV